MTTLFMYMSYTSLFLITLFYFLPVGLMLGFFNRRLRKQEVPKKSRRFVIFSVAVVLFLLPTWDAILGKHYLDQYCERDGGLYDYHTERIGSVFIDGQPSEHNASFSLNRGFDFVEMGSPGDYVRFSWAEDQEIVSEPITKLGSKVRRAYEGPNKHVGPDFLNLKVFNRYLEDVETGDPVAGFRNYTFFTSFDHYLGKIGSTPITRCTDIPRFQDDERFPEDTSIYLNVARS